MKVIWRVNEHLFLGGWESPRGDQGRWSLGRRVEPREQRMRTSD